MEKFTAQERRDDLHRISSGNHEWLWAKRLEADQYLAAVRLATLVFTSLVAVGATPCCAPRAPALEVTMRCATSCSAWPLEAVPTPKQNPKDSSLHIHGFALLMSYLAPFTLGTWQQWMWG